MSRWGRAPRQVYEVHGEDDYLAGNGAPPNVCAMRQVDASVESSSAARVLGLALLAVVTLGAISLVLLHASHRPMVRQSVAEPHASPNPRRRAFPGTPSSAPPPIHRPPHSGRHVRAPTVRVARSHRLRKRIAGGHVQPIQPSRLALPPTDERPIGVPVGAAGEFDFER